MSRKNKRKSKKMPQPPAERGLIGKAKRVTLPGFDGVPLHDVVVFFWQGIMKGAITTRASAIAFSFFLGVFPAIIFLFTLIPFIPIQNFQSELLSLLADIMPIAAFRVTENTLTEIITIKRGDLLSYSFIAAIVFSTNGIHAMIDAFNASFHVQETRTWVSQRLVSIALVTILSVLITTAIILTTFGEMVMNILVQYKFMKLDFTYYLLSVGKWLIILALIFFAISFMYYLAPAKRIRWRFVSAGSTFASVLTLVVSGVFSFYVNNFGQYNKLYGSIGTLIAILVGMYFNAIILLVGFELNSSILNARHKMLKP